MRLFANGTPHHSEKSQNFIRVKSRVIPPMTILETRRGTLPHFGEEFPHKMRMRNIYIYIFMTPSSVQGDRVSKFIQI